jgi:hypothetical protein
MASDDPVAALEAELASLSGPARTGALVRLGQALLERYWRIGPGQAAALPVLNRAVETVGEAYRYLAPTDPLRGHVAALLGWLLGARHCAHAGANDDRETAIGVLEEALTYPALPPAFAAMARVMLAQSYLSRAVGGFGGVQTIGAAMAGVAPAARTDVDRAVLRLREVPDGRAVSKQLNDAARALLAMAEALQAVFAAPGGGPTSVGPRRVAEAVAFMQNVQPAGLGPIRLPMSPFLGADSIAAGDPLDYPVAVVQDATAPAAPAEPIRRAAAVPLDRAVLRRRVHEKVTAAADADAGAPVWAVAADLLRPSAALPAVEAVDDLVALASLLVDGQPADAVDRFLHAVALLLRARVDPLGAADHRNVGIESLLAAVRVVPINHPGLVAIVGALGAFLDERRPIDDVLVGVAGAYADRIDAILTTTAVVRGQDLAVLHALRCLCRAATDGSDGSVARAVGTVPLDYPWLPVLQAAAQACA